MSTEILAPQPQRPSKRAFTDSHSDPFPASKHAQQSLSLLPTPSTHHRRYETPRAPRRPASQSFENLERPNKSPKKRRQLQSPRLEPTADRHPRIPRTRSAPPRPACEPESKDHPSSFEIDSSVKAWLFTVSSPVSRPVSPPTDCPSPCPASLSTSNLNHAPASLSAIQQMMQQQSKYPESQGSSSGASQKGRPCTSSSLYRDTIFNNYITMDFSGRQLPQKLRGFVDQHILKPRTSPQLGDELVSKVVDTAEELADSSEGPVNKLLRTPMFPIDHTGIAEGGNTPWNMTALPNNPEYEYNLAAPKPDAYLGYSRGQQSGWSTSQYNVISHPKARPYTQPGRGNTFPFLMFELKSEAAGGTLYAAENRAAGSGSHSVNALLWLLEEARKHGLSDFDSLEDTVSFSFVVSHREAVFYIHWRSPEEKRFYISRLKSYSTFEPDEIRACNIAVKNTVEKALGTRKTKIGDALQALFPIPEHWGPYQPTDPSRVVY
ncbi:MAG: hypothetical protein Q9227_000848 [Pyrenula ochraceoflavens]